MNKLSWGDGPTQYFFELTPDKVMDALEQFPVMGTLRRGTGYCQPLGSFENRVYEVEFENEEDSLLGPASSRGARAVAKFYRPGRWSKEQLIEEHEFMTDILAAEVPVVIPYYFEKEKDTLRQTPEGLYFCLYPKVGGRQPEDLKPEQLEQLGRLIARMHMVGKAKKAKHRVYLTPASYGTASLNFLLEDRCVNPQVEQRFEAVVRDIVKLSEELFQNQPLQRIHGDCHAGNILWNEKTGPFFIDFDDMVMGPPIQDLWLLAPDPEQMKHLINGYQMMNDLPMGSLKLVEALRSLRMIHYATWIAKRYDDPAFQKAFPQFESPKYWDDLTLDLERQLHKLYREKSGYDSE